MKKKIIIALIFLTSTVIIAFLQNEKWLKNHGYYDDIPVEIKKRVFSFEYGKDIPRNIEYYFDTLSDRLDECTFELYVPEDGLVSEGIYLGHLKWKNEWKEKNITFTISVVDVNFPIIMLKQSYFGIDYGGNVDIKENVLKAFDTIEGELKWSIEGEYNSKKSGNYPIVVKATDFSGNCSEKTFTISVGKKPTPSISFMETNDSTYPKKYKDSGIEIAIEKEWHKNAWCYIADIKLKDYSRFSSALAYDTYNGKKETPSHAYKRLNAIFLVNGAYEKPSRNFPVLKNGKVWVDNLDGFTSITYNKNTGVLKEGIHGISLGERLAAGEITDTWYFYDPIIVDNEYVNWRYEVNTERAQRTILASKGVPGEFYVSVCMGRYVDGVSPGLTYKEVADIFKAKGFNYIAPLDGGGGSTMVFKGEVLHPLQGGTERPAMDFAYISK